MLTLGPKVAHYARTAVPLQARFEVKVESFLTELGWSRAGELWLAIGLHRAVRYVSRACPEGAWIAVLPTNGEANRPLDGIIREGDRLFFVYDGTASDGPPRYAEVKEKLGWLSENLGLTLFRRSPYLAVVAPADCHLESAVPWRAL
jgi:hypothetical protein